MNAKETKELVSKVKAMELLGQLFDDDGNVDLENPILMAFYRYAIDKKCCCWKSAKSHRVGDDILENGKYYPDGWLIFDHQTPKIWSFKNISQVAKFLESR